MKSNRLTARNMHTISKPLVFLLLLTWTQTCHTAELLKFEPGAYTSSDEITCSDSKWNEKLLAGYKAMFEDDYKKRTYQDNKNFFLEAYCGSSNYISLTEKCYAVTTAINATAPQKKYLIYVANCPGNMVGVKNYITISNAQLNFSEFKTVVNEGGFHANTQGQVSFSATCEDITCPAPKIEYITLKNPAGYQQKCEYAYELKKEAGALCKHGQECKKSATCNNLLSFRCADNYYGPTDQTNPTGCTPCSDDFYKCTSTAGSNSKINDCTCTCQPGKWQYLEDEDIIGNYYIRTDTNNKVIERIGCTPCPSYYEECKDTNISCIQNYYLTNSNTQLCIGVSDDNRCINWTNDKQCVPCPNSGDCQGKTHGPGATGPEACYIDDKCQHTDDIGTYEYGAYCHYNTPIVEPSN